MMNDGSRGGDATQNSSEEGIDPGLILLVAAELSIEIDQLAEESEVGQSAEPEMRVELPVRILAESDYFSESVRRETDLLFARDVRLDDASRLAMLRGSKRALADRHAEDDPLRSLDNLMLAIHDVPDVDDGFRSLQEDPAKSIDPVARRRAAADQLGYLLDAVSTGELKAEDADLDEIVAVIHEADIGKWLALLGFTGAAERSQMLRRDRQPIVRGVRAGSRVEYGDWADFLAELRRRLSD